MSAPGWRRRSRPSASPPESSSPDRFASFAARAAAGVVGFRRGLAAALLCVPLLAVLATGAAAQTVVPESWPLKPAGLSAGDRFRLLFVTSTTRDATATDIATYNSFVQTAAAAGHTAIQPYSSQFRVLGSTSAVDARDNTSSTGTGVPIYWLNGDKAADDYADFYDGSWDSRVTRNELGGSTTTLNQFAWTGSDADGTKSSVIPGRGHLGDNANVARGDRELYTDFNSSSTSYPFYALSPVFEIGTVGPSLSVSDATVAEDTGLARMRFTVSLSEALSREVRVRVLTRESDPRSARWYRDFVPKRTDLTFRPGETAKQVQVFILPDREAEGPETFELVLLNATGAGVSDGVGVGTITDSAAPGVSVSRAALTVDEGGAAGSYTVSLDAPPASGQTVTVTATPDDAAAVRVNGAASAVLRFTGANWNEPRTVTVTGREDADTDDASVTVTHAVSGGGSGWSGVTAPDVTVTVKDRIPPSGDPAAGFALAASSAGEGAGTATVRVTLSHAAAAALPLTYTAGGTATSGTDYTALSGTVTVPSGATGADITVSITQDSANEPDETVVLTLSEGTGYTVGGTAAHTLTITDDDEPPPSSPSVSIAPASGAAVTEGGDAAFTLTADRAPTSGLAVTVRVSDVAGRDFVAEADEGAQTVTIASGQTTATLTVTTQADEVDEPGGRVTAAVLDGEGYKVGATSSASAAVVDDDPTTVTLAAPAGAIIEDEGAKLLTVTLGRALVAGETLDVPVTMGGTATNRRDYRLQCWSDPGVQCRYVGSPGGLVRFIGGPRAARVANLRVQALDDGEHEGAEAETVTVSLGGPSGNLDGGATVSAGVSIDITDDDDPLPAVTITGGSAVTEGGNAVFTVSASPAPSADLAVQVDVSDAASGDFLARADEGRRTVTVASGAASATLTLATRADTVDEPDGKVRASLAEGAGYTRGGPSAATVDVSDDDAATQPTLSIGDATLAEGAGVRARWPVGSTYMRFTVTLSAPQRHWVRVYARTRDSTPASARARQDYWPAYLRASFSPGRTEAYFYVKIMNDSHNEDPETFELVLFNPSGAAIGDGLGIGTITNDDPMPAAFLARVGRTLAQQTLDGITGRLAAARTPGLQGTLAGQALSLVPTTAGSTPNDGTGNAPAGLLTRLLAGFSPGMGGAPAAFEPTYPLDDPRRGALQSSTRLPTAREALLGSSFTLTAQPDATGGSLGFWGRAGQGFFDGAERGDGTAITLDGTVTTGLLGADYARGDWLVGVALSQSQATGTYAAIGQNPCAMPDVELCDGAVRAGDGKTETTLTAAIPYAALQVAERLQLWGAGGYGAGDVTLKTMEEHYEADTTWAMAAAGLRGDLLATAPGVAGPALAVTSDALWTRTDSDQTRDLSASESHVTRLRLGLAGSYQMALGTATDVGPGASLTPKLELGARHDGGDAETGLGVEIGGGVTWLDQALGLSLDLAGRTLLAHENDDLEDRGFSAALAFDPTPATPRGPALRIRQAVGSQATGGLNALFTAAPLADRTGTTAPSRWDVEAAYGFPAFGGRFTGSPHLGVGLGAGMRNYSLGWRLTPEATSTTNFVVDLTATRQERDAAIPVHTVGLEIMAQW